MNFRTMIQPMRVCIWATTFLLTTCLVAAAPASPTAVIEPTAPVRPAVQASTAATTEKRAPVTADLTSPQATVRTFLQAMSRINHQALLNSTTWEVVLGTFDTSHLKISDGELHEAARRLQQALDKLGVNPDQLPNADSVARGGERLGRYVVFPSEEGDYAWVWESLAKFNRWPEGQIVLVATTPGAWRFSAQTIQGIEALAKSLTPLPPKHVAQDHGGQAERVLGILGPTFTQTQWWQWGALLGCIFLGLAVGKAASASLKGLAQRFAKRRWRMRAAAVTSCAGPLNLAIFTLALAAGLLSFVVKEHQIAGFIKQTILCLYLIAGAWLIYNLVDVLDLLMHRAASRTSATLDNMIVPLVRKALRLFVLVVFVLVIADSVFGIDITGWLAGLGIAGLAVSLAAQDSIKNLFGSLTVFFDHPFAVGDFITYSGVSGTVEEIGFRSTKLRLPSGHVVTVPNMKWIDDRVENISRRPSIRREMNVRLPYDTPLDKVEEAVQIVIDVLNDATVIEEGCFDMENNAPKISLNELNPDSINIRAYYWYQLAGGPDRGFYTWLAHCDKVNRMIIHRFHHAGIEFALPSQSLRLANDMDRRLDVRMIGDNDSPTDPAVAATQA